MAKNDFDVDFDFEKEYGFDPDAILGSEYTDEELDLSQFEEDFRDADSAEAAAEDFEDFDLDGIDLGDIDLDGLDLDGDVPGVESRKNIPYTPAPKTEPEPVDLRIDDIDDADDQWSVPESADLGIDDFDDADDRWSVPEPDFEEEEALDFDDDDLDFGDDDKVFPDADEFDDGEDLTAGIDFGKRATFFGEPEAQEDDFVPPAYDQADAGELPDAGYETEAETGEVPMESEVTEKPVKPVRRKERVKAEGAQKPAREPIKLAMPMFLVKLGQLYFPSRQQIAERMEGGEGKDGRRRRRPSRQQIFKEFYLPTIIAGLALVLIVSFVIGAVSNSIDRMLVEQKEKEQLAQQESMAAEQMAFEAQELLARAEILAQSYDYQGAVDLLNSYTGEPTQEMTIKLAEYVNIRSTLVEHQDPTLIPNLSFHVLIHDMNRALADDDGLAGQYNRNFVTTEEFSKILNQLYMNNFVLVDFDSFVTSNSVDGTSSSFFADSIWLPEGKKPVMITETMVNYFTYMIDGNDDGTPDSGGDGFASRLVVDGNGDIKAEYVDENNVTHVGNFDLVPILEDFIAQHPDFSYQGARATLAVSGSEGIFGYRIQSETIAKKGQDYYNEQVVGATKVVEALKAKGYRLACYTFDNKDYKNISAAMVQEDLQKWKSQISPVIGELDTIVFARASDIGDYTGGKFDVLSAAGFRFLVKNAEVPYTEVNNAYVRQSRLMVTGENMVAKPNMFIDTGVFDPNTVLDLATRGDVPTG